jgi:alpha-D-xyloside xylohydrolase
MNIRKLHNGIYKLTFGEPEKLTAMSFKRYETKAGELSRLSDKEMPFDAEDIEFKTVKSGCVLRIPLSEEEEIYGFGLQLKGFRHTGKKKHIRPNADPLSDSGDSHAPVPYYVSTKGYAILVDTARYASFYCGQSKSKGVSRETWEAYNAQISEEALYSAHEKEIPAKTLVEIPTAKGVDVYVFAGENMLEAVSKYKLFSGGGADFPEWAFGIWYRNF